MGPAQYETVFSAHFSYGISVQKQYNFVYYKKTLYEICVCMLANENLVEKGKN